MSEPIPESIPTSANPRSKRPTKKRALTPLSAQAASIDTLFAKPDQEIRIPSSDPKAKSKVSAPPEIVANVQGSSAGAGSGEFHVYKASRRREYERLKAMDEEVRKENEGEDFVREKSARDERDKEKTRKNREKREKMKARKQKEKVDTAGGLPSSDLKDSGAAGGIKGPRIISRDVADGEEMLGHGANPSNNAEEIGVIIHDDD